MTESTAKRPKGPANLRPRTGGWTERIVGVAYRARVGQRSTFFNVCQWCAQPILWEKNKGAE